MQSLYATPLDLCVLPIYFAGIISSRDRPYYLCCPEIDQI